MWFKKIRDHQLLAKSIRVIDVTTHKKLHKLIPNLVILLSKIPKRNSKKKLLLFSEN